MAKEKILYNGISYNLLQWLAFPRETIDEILEEIADHQADNHHFIKIEIEYTENGYIALGKFIELGR